MFFFSFFFSCLSEKEQGFDYVFEADLSSEESQTNDDTSTAVEEPEDVVENAEEPEPEPSNPNPDDESTEGSEICGSLTEGTDIGDCAQNFSLTDIDQEMISLHDFHGQVIFLDLSSFT